MEAQQQQNVSQVVDFQAEVVILLDQTKPMNVSQNLKTEFKQLLKQ